MRCVGCGHREMEVFFEAQGVPVFNNVLWPDRQQAMDAPRADIRLGFCSCCSLIHNVAFDPQDVQYAPNYENSLHYSPTFQRYAEGLAAELVRRHNLHDKDIIEIGCGQGDFLDMLCRAGNNRGRGFDPGYQGGRAEGQGNVAILAEPYTASQADVPADFVCCRQVLEHISRPGEFLADIRRAVGNRQGVTVCFEVPNALWTLRDLGVWDIIYEHCSYFVPESLQRLFLLAGFVPLRLEQVFDGQFLLLEASPAEPAEKASCNVANPETIRLIIEFNGAYRSKLAFWTRELARFRQKQRRAVVWGGGSKGVSFLNALHVSWQDMPYVVDLNPRKADRFVPCTGQQTIPPERLRDYRPDTIILMNPIYLDEVRRLAAELAPQAEILTA